MAELTTLDEKLAEVLGLAQAAQVATKRVATLARKQKETELLELMNGMGDEAARVEQRCDVAAGTRDGMKSAITKKARETKAELTGFMKTYLEDAEALDGLEFLSMAEAGELCHWEIVEKMSETIGAGDVQQLATWAVGVQREHVETVRRASLWLAAHEASAA